MSFMFIYAILIGCRIEENRTSLQDRDGDGFSPATGDCDDVNAEINPNAEEICDGADNNCDGEIDEQGGSLYYTDEDGDGFGDPATEEHHCSEPSQQIAQSGDCDDGNRSDNDNLDDNLKLQWQNDSDTMTMIQ